MNLFVSFQSSNLIYLQSFYQCKKLFLSFQYFSPFIILIIKAKAEQYCLLIVKYHHEQHFLFQLFYNQCKINVNSQKNKQMSLEKEQNQVKQQQKDSKIVSVLKKSITIPGKGVVLGAKSVVKVGQKTIGAFANLFKKKKKNNDLNFSLQEKGQQIDKKSQGQIRSDIKILKKQKEQHNKSNFSEDDEIQVLMECPITNTIMKYPVFIKQCGHTFILLKNNKYKFGLKKTKIALFVKGQQVFKALSQIINQRQSLKATLEKEPTNNQISKNNNDKQQDQPQSLITNIQNMIQTDFIFMNILCILIKSYNFGMASQQQYYEGKVFLKAYSDALKTLDQITGQQAEVQKLKAYQKYLTYSLKNNAVKIVNGTIEKGNNFQKTELRSLGNFSKDKLFSNLGLQKAQNTSQLISIFEQYINS